MNLILALFTARELDDGKLLVDDAPQRREIRLFKSPLLVAVVGVHRVQDLALDHLADWGRLLNLLVALLPLKAIFN